MVEYHPQEPHIMEDSVIEDWIESQAGLEEANSNVINCLWKELHGRDLWMVTNI